MNARHTILRRCLSLALFGFVLANGNLAGAQDKDPQPADEKAPSSAEPAAAPADVRPEQADSEPAPENPSAKAAKEAAAALPQPPVAATVNGEPIYVAEAQAYFSRIAQKRRLPLQGQEKNKAEVLKQLVQQRLVAKALQRDGNDVDEKAIQKGVGNIEFQAKQQRLTLAEYLNKKGMGIEALRHEIYWNLAWNHYQERHLADALEGYFKAHHQQFDGTQLRVSHLVLRAKSYQEKENQIVQRAEAIRQEIESGTITFEQGVEKYSVGPSRYQKGDLGFITRQGMMVEEFAKAAFALEPGEISKPVSTPYGTHLIRVTEVKPGAKQWTEVLDQIKTPASIDLFEKLAEQERASAQIEYTGKWPYFDPESEELISADSAAK